MIFLGVKVHILATKEKGLPKVERLSFEKKSHFVTTL
jgi:hypothetical protein